MDLVCRRIHFDHSHIGIHIGADHRAIGFEAGGESDFHFTCAFHHMLVCDHMSFTVKDKARAQAGAGLNRNDAGEHLLVKRFECASHFRGVGGSRQDGRGRVDPQDRCRLRRERGDACHLAGKHGHHQNRDYKEYTLHFFLPKI
jgi:hypothetical protein